MAPRRPDSALAVALSRPLAALDPPVDAVIDVMNRRVPGLWWPLAVPARERAMPPRAHVLSAVHAGVGWAVARRFGGRLATAAAVAGWLLCTGAWDRRALG